MATELEVLQYVLGLDGLGLGGKAHSLLARHMARDVRPLLLKQKRALDAATRLDGGRRGPAAPDVPGLDRAAKDLEAEIAAAWGRCLDSLRTLWLTEGPTDTEAA